MKHMSTEHWDIEDERAGHSVPRLIGRLARYGFYSVIGIAVLEGLLGGLDFVLAVSCFLGVCWLSWVLEPRARAGGSAVGAWGNAVIQVILVTIAMWAWWTGRLSFFSR